MPHVTACAVMSYAHRVVHTCKPAAPIMPEITYGHAVHASRTIFIKINHLTF